MHAITPSLPTPAPGKRALYVLGQFDLSLTTQATSNLSPLPFPSPGRPHDLLRHILATSQRDADGGMGTTLQAPTFNLALDSALWSSELLASQSGRDQLVRLHDTWIEAGADIVQTCT